MGIGRLLSPRRRMSGGTETGMMPCLVCPLLLLPLLLRPTANIQTSPTSTFNNLPANPQTAAPPSPRPARAHPPAPPPSPSPPSPAPSVPAAVPSPLRALVHRPTPRLHKPRLISSRPTQLVQPAMPRTVRPPLSPPDMVRKLPEWPSARRRRIQLQMRSGLHRMGRSLEGMCSLIQMRR